MEMVINHWILGTSVDMFTGPSEIRKLIGDFVDYTTIVYKV